MTIQVCITEFCMGDGVVKITLNDWLCKRCALNRGLVVMCAECEEIMDPKKDKMTNYQSQFYHSSCFNDITKPKLLSNSKS